MQADLMNPLTLLYRGPLSSCNYGCAYCPFAKHHETPDEHSLDGEKLERFVSWCEAFGRPLRVFFTPWGEALTQVRYQRAMVRLSGLPHVQKVAIQTNLSANLSWLEAAEISKIGLWATYHPEWTKSGRFLKQCEKLTAMGVSFSVGIVGFPEAIEAMRDLREKLPKEIYLWVNAVKSLGVKYTSEHLQAFREVDKLFDFNLQKHPSFQKFCAGGHTVLSVDGDGVARSCHFIREPLGNLFTPGFVDSLQPKRCSAESCGCHIGYVHLEYLELNKIFGSGILERVPQPKDE
jgi:MoaA/NifB/PqqE/SkfB family radical SAM enzyme